MTDTECKTEGCTRIARGDFDLCYTCGHSEENKQEGFKDNPGAFFGLCANQALTVTAKEFVHDDFWDKYERALIQFLDKNSKIRENFIKSKENK